MTAAVLALLAEVIAGQERAEAQLTALRTHVDERLIEERVRVETIANIIVRERESEPKGLTVVQGAQTTPGRGGTRGTT